MDHITTLPECRIAGQRPFKPGVAARDAMKGKIVAAASALFARSVRRMR
jgi:hypothetical protein